LPLSAATQNVLQLWELRRHILQRIERFGAELRQPVLLPRPDVHREEEARSQALRPRASVIENQRAIVNLN
jgi:hypothetical protein